MRSGERGGAGVGRTGEDTDIIKDCTGYRSDCFSARREVVSVVSLRGERPGGKRTHREDLRSLR